MLSLYEFHFKATPTEAATPAPFPQRVSVANEELSVNCEAGFIFDRRV